MTIKNNIRRILIPMLIAMLAVSLIVGAVFYYLYSNNEKEVIASAEIIIKEKWNSIYNLKNNKEYKNASVFNYSNLNEPIYYYAYTIGYNDINKVDSTYFIKFELQYEGLKLRLKKKPSIDYGFYFSTITFDKMQENLRIKSFEEIKKLNDGKSISQGTPEPTLEELQARKEEEISLKKSGEKREICYDPKIALYVVKEGTIKSIEEASRFLKEGRQPVSNISQQTVDNVTEIWEEYIATNELEQRATPLNELTQENKNTIEYCKPLVAFGGELNPSEIFKFVD